MTWQSLFCNMFENRLLDNKHNSSLDKTVFESLTIRLAPFLDNMVDKAPIGFIQGRMIADNLLCAPEIPHYCKRNRINVCKLDFKKTLDNLNWDFLLFIIKTRGFLMKWIESIEALYHFSNEFVVFINGKAGNKSNC